MAQTTAALAQERPVIHSDQQRSPLDQRISFGVDDVSLADALHALSLQSHVAITYRSDDIAGVARRISFHGVNIPLRRVLDTILAGTGMTAGVTMAGQIYLERAAHRVGAKHTDAEGTIEGRATDALTAEQIAGVSIRVVGADRGATTDDSGYYRIGGIPPGSYAVQSHRVGYAPVTMTAIVQDGGTVVVDFTMRKTPSTLEQVVVTGSVIPTERKRLPTPISVVTAADFRRQNLTRVDQIFRGIVPGSIAFDYGTSDYNTVAMVRGANTLLERTIKTYVDGVELADPVFGEIDPNSIDHVEVIRGPEASTIYGSDASGGVMQIFTKKGDPGATRPQVDATVMAAGIESQFKAGATLRHSEAVTVRGGSTEFGYNLGGSYERIGEWVPGYSSSRPSFFAGGQMEQGALHVNFAARYFERTVGQAVDPRLTAKGYVPFSRPDPTVQEDKLATYGVHASFDPTPWWKNNLLLGADREMTNNYTKHARYTTPADSTVNVVSGQAAKASIGFNTTFVLPEHVWLAPEITVGVDHYVYNVDAYSAYGALANIGPILTLPGAPPVPVRDEIVNTGVFGQVQLALRDRLFVTAGVRGERNSNFGADYGTAVSPRVGVSYVLAIGGVMGKLRASYGEATRAPVSDTKYPIRSPYVIELANPNIGPERQTGADVGVELYFGTRASVAATYYNQRALGLIDNVILPPAPTDTIAKAQWQNVGRIGNTGYEFEGHLSAGPVTVSGQFSIMDSKVERLAPGYTGDYRVGDRVLLVPRKTGGASVTYSSANGQTSVAASLTYIGAWTYYDAFALDAIYYGGATYSGSLRDYRMPYRAVAKGNITIAQRVTDHWQALLAVSNIANNNRPEQRNDRMIPGRTTSIGVRLSY